MVNKLSELADFLDDDSLPPWLKEMLKEKRQEIASALENGRSITLSGPYGEKITVAAKGAATAA